MIALLGVYLTMILALKRHTTKLDNSLDPMDYTKKQVSWSARCTVENPRTLNDGRFGEYQRAINFGKTEAGT